MSGGCPAAVAVRLRMAKGFFQLAGRVKVDRTSRARGQRDPAAGWHEGNAMQPHRSVESLQEQVSGPVRTGTTTESKEATR